MTLAQTLKLIGWPAAKAALLWSYPDVAESISSYKLVLANLRQLVPEESKMRIVLRETYREGIDDEPFIEVVGRNGDLNRDQPDFKYSKGAVDADYANSETDYSLSMEPWERWLGMEIDPSALEKFSVPQIIAHCVWEMTFHGFEQWQVKETLDEIRRRAAEIDAMSEDERREKLIPMEDVMKKFDSWKAEK